MKRSIDLEGVIGLQTPFHRKILQKKLSLCLFLDSTPFLIRGENWSLDTATPLSISRSAHNVTVNC